MANHDPNSNRMFRDDMGASNGGCKCQTRWLVTVENGEVVYYQGESDHPCHLRSLQKALDDGDVVQEGDEYFYHWDANAVHTPDDEGEPPAPPIEVVEVNGDRYYRKPCDSTEHAKDDLCEEMRKKPDGTYTAIVEYACFSSYNYEYGVDEGDSDAVFLVEPATKEGDANV